MAGQPHVPPHHFAPPTVHLLTSSPPNPAASNLRSDPIPPLFLLHSSDSASLPPPTAAPSLPPPPLPPPSSAISAANTSASNPNPISLNPIFMISAPSSSSVTLPPLASSLYSSSLSAASPTLSFNLSSAPASSTVISRFISSQSPVSSSTAAFPPLNPSPRSAPSSSSEIAQQPLLPSIPPPRVNPTTQTPSLPQNPNHKAQPPQHTPQAPPSSNSNFRTTPATVPYNSVSKHHQPSYAQVARGPRGPGFVRSHASDIESFARLPRTGINIISGSREGIPSFSFVNSDLPKVEGLYSKALVMKFHGGRPSLESSHKEILTWGIEQPFSIGPLSSRSFLLRFQEEKDLLKVLSRPSTSLITYPYRVFRWHNLCHLKEDSCIAPVWISLPRLPLQCFIPEFLESVANKIGRFLCLDKATATLARPSAARLCVEIDLRKPPPQFIWIGLFDGFKQQIIYERLLKFCNGCYIQGHTSMECSNSPLDTLHATADGREPNPHGSTPHVRHNASTKKSSAYHHNQVPPPLTLNNPTSTNPSIPTHAENPPTNIPHNQTDQHTSTTIHQPSPHIRDRPPPHPNVLPGESPILEHQIENPTKHQSNTTANHLKNLKHSTNQKSKAQQQQSVAI